MSEDSYTPGTSGNVPPSLEQDIHEDLNRVREIILGSDPLRERLQPAEVDRLREILFGAQIQEYERRFGDITRTIDRMGADLIEARERLGELEKALWRRMETLELNLRRLTDELSREKDRQRRHEILVQQLATQVRQHEETLKASGDAIVDLRKAHTSYENELRSTRTTIIDVRDQIEQRGQALRREFRQNDDDLRAELHRVAERLAYQKTDRKALASMLIEVAARLETGSSITGLLEGLTSPKE